MIRDIDEELLNRWMANCECDILDDFISNGTLLCFPSSPSFITYRAFVQGNMAVPTMTLVSYIEEWLKAGAEIHVNGQLFPVQFGCPIVISSVNEIECDPYNKTIVETSKNRLFIIYISVSIACLLTAIAIIVSITVAAKLNRKPQKTTSKESFNM